MTFYDEVSKAIEEVAKKYIGKYFVWEDEVYIVEDLYLDDSCFGELVVDATTVEREGEQDGEIIDFAELMETNVYDTLEEAKGDL